VRAGTEIRLFTTDDSTAVPEPDSIAQDTTAAGDADEEKGL
jgi:hypothetical protein